MKLISRNFFLLFINWLFTFFYRAGFAIVLGIGIVSFIKFLLYVIFVDCIGVGICIATILWFVSNKMLLKSQSTELDVEWGFCFDVHLNAFFPLLVILHFIQLFFYSILISKPWFIATLFGNTLWYVIVHFFHEINFTKFFEFRISGWWLLDITCTSLFWVTIPYIFWNGQNYFYTHLFHSFLYIWVL